MKVVKKKELNIFSVGKNSLWDAMEHNTLDELTKVIQQLFLETSPISVPIVDAAKSEQSKVVDGKHIGDTFSFGWVE